MCAGLLHFFEDEVLCFDEIVLGHAITEDVCKEFSKRYPDHMSGLVIYGDQTGTRGGTRSNKNDYEIIEEQLGYYPGFEIRLPTVNPPVKDRVGRFRSKLRNTRGEVTFFHSPRCVKLKKDLRKLSYKPGTYEIEKTGKAKKLSHISDAVGYGIIKEYPLVRYSSNIETEQRVY